MKVPGLRSAYDEVGGIVYFGRMLDKIRLKAKESFPTDYKTGTRLWLDFDARCTRFLKVSYGTLKKRTLQGGSDLQILRWCFKRGRRPSKEDVEIWNTFMRKRGWRDPSSEGLERDAGGAGGLSKSIEYEPTRAGKKIFKKKIGRAVEFRGCQTTKGAGQIKPKEKYHAIHDADDPRRLSRR